MAYRDFVDEHGTAWEAWDVHPTHVERRLERSGARGAAGGPVVERRTTESGARMQVRPEYTQGWLAFQSRHERRRLAPVPPDWAELDDAGLSRLLDRATPIGPGRRLVE